MQCYGPDYNTPEVGEAKAKEIAPHLLELCRLAVEQWYRCSPTPQPLSLTIIRMRDAVIFAAREEQDELQRRDQAGSSGQATTGSVGGAGTPGSADLGSRAAGTDRADQPGEVLADHA
jgi:hypothetical protein